MPKLPLLPDDSIPALPDVLALGDFMEAALDKIAPEIDEFANQLGMTDERRMVAFVGAFAGQTAFWACSLGWSKEHFLACCAQLYDTTVEIRKDPAEFNRRMTAYRRRGQS